MHYSVIKTHDVANGPGVRVSLFVSGCEHACPGCFNPESWQFHFGEPYTQATQRRILEALAPPHIRGLTLLGGEPLHPRNRTAVQNLAAQAHALPGKDIWCYTGYVFEKELLPQTKSDPTLRRLLEQIDVLVDGRFLESRRDLGLRFRGSSNQRILRLPESLQAEKAVLWEFM